MFWPTQGPSSGSTSYRRQYFMGFKLIDVEISSSFFYLFYDNMWRNNYEVRSFDFLTPHLLCYTHNSRLPYVFNYICTVPNMFRISRKNKITYWNTNPAIRNINFNNYNSILLGIIVPVCAMSALLCDQTYSFTHYLKFH